MNYGLLRSLLFQLEPELAHHVSLQGMKWLHRLGCSGLYRSASIATVPVTCMGLEFANPVGLAAGLDKNGDYIDALGDLGFGFIEVGTVTPRPQPGNPRPRLFRLPEHEAIINRMGFNNKGVDHLIKQVERRRYSGVVGINIGKNFDTPVENAHQDYLTCLEKVYPVADYVTVNLSSPNTPGLRKLQVGEALRELVDSLADKKTQLQTRHQKNVPLLIKVAPDMSEAEIDDLVNVVVEAEVDGLIATNTTINKALVAGHPFGSETGGLSGRPVFEASTQVLSRMAPQLKDKMALIGVGGITDIETAKEKLSAGADLLQVYTGFIYQGPDLIKQICEQLAAEI